ncbi:MAG: exodeoxyribonuclease VII small subunit [Alphaproteobacteria bacterium]
MKELMTFEKALEELETIVKKLELAQDSLENSIALYEKGVQLKKFCEEKLKDATLKIEKISLSSNGTPELVDQI